VTILSSMPVEGGWLVQSI